MKDKVHFTIFYFDKLSDRFHCKKWKRYPSGDNKYKTYKQAFISFEFIKINNKCPDRQFRIVKVDTIFDPIVPDGSDSYYIVTGWIMMLKSYSLLSAEGWEHMSNVSSQVEAEEIKFQLENQVDMYEYAIGEPKPVSRYSNYTLKCQGMVGLYKRGGRTISSQAAYPP